MLSVIFTLLLSEHFLCRRMGKKTLLPWGRFIIKCLKLWENFTTLCTVSCRYMALSSSLIQNTQRRHEFNIHNIKLLKYLTGFNILSWFTSAVAYHSEMQLTWQRSMKNMKVTGRKITHNIQTFKVFVQHSTLRSMIMKVHCSWNWNSRQ